MEASFRCPADTPAKASAETTRDDREIHRAYESHELCGRALFGTSGRLCQSG